MPSNDNGCIRPDEAKRARTVFHLGLDYDDFPPSPTDSGSTDNLEDIISPPVITPQSVSSVSSVSEELEQTSSEDDLIIPLYLFHTVERSSLNIEFNRCLQLSLLHENPNFTKKEEEERNEVGEPSGVNGMGDINIDQINLELQSVESLPTVQLSSDAFQELLEIINYYIQEFDDPEMLMELVNWYLTSIEETETSANGEEDNELPSWMFEEPEEIEVLIPPYLFQIDESEFTARNQVLDILAAGDFQEIDSIVALLSDKESQ